MFTSDQSWSSRRALPDGEHNSNNNSIHGFLRTESFPVLPRRRHRSAAALLSSSRILEAPLAALAVLTRARATTLAAIPSVVVFAFARFAAALLSFLLVGGRA